MIANTLSITVAQRTREFATLRTLGATRRQVLGSVIVEALVIGFLASVVGLFAGLALAKLLNQLFVSFGIDLPKAGTVFATRTIVVSLVLGIVVTLLASLRPAAARDARRADRSRARGRAAAAGRFARLRPAVRARDDRARGRSSCSSASSTAAATKQRLLAIGVGVLAALRRRRDDRSHLVRAARGVARLARRRASAAPPGSSHARTRCAPRRGPRRPRPR